MWLEGGRALPRLVPRAVRRGRGRDSADWRTDSCKLLQVSIWMPAGPFRTAPLVRHEHVCLSELSPNRGLVLGAPATRRPHTGWLASTHQSILPHACWYPYAARVLRLFNIPVAPSMPQAFLRRPNSSTLKRVCPRARPSPPPHPPAAGGTTPSTAGPCRRRRCGGQRQRPPNYDAFQQHCAERLQSATPANAPPLHSCLLFTTLACCRPCGTHSPCRPYTPAAPQVPKWKQQSAQLRAAMAANRQVVDAKAQGKDLRSLPPAPSMPDDRWVVVRVLGILKGGQWKGYRSKQGQCDDRWSAGEC